MLVSLRLDGVDDLLAAMADVGDQDAAREVEPAIATGVIHLEAFGAVPDHQRLASHGAEFVPGELFKDGD